jgi:BirA family biotin operon repressor/biotin-[acetyl-CoA-carboxylase] ligase
LQEFITDEVLLKWPNDIFVKNKKIAGILLDIKQKNGQLVAVLGIGVNLNVSKLDNVGQMATSVYLEAGEIDRTLFLKKLIVNLDNCVQNHLQNGFDAVNYNKYHLLNQKSVHLLEDGQSSPAFVEEVNSDGCLKVTGYKEELLSSGNISIRLVQ